MADSIRLNVGCGYQKLPGYINCDFADNWTEDLSDEQLRTKPDVACDVRKLPFPDNCADEVMAIHVLEHFYRYEAPDVLAEWIRVLKPGGKLIIEVPCLDKIVYWLTRDKAPVRFTMWALYGDPNYKNPHMVHRWAYSVAELRVFLKQVGLVNVTLQEPKFHVPGRDMRYEAEKQ